MTMLADRLRAALPTAMKARDAAAVTALRSALAAVENAAAVAVPEPSADRAGRDPADLSRAELGLPAVGLGVTEAPRRVVDDAEVERIVRAEVADRLAAAGEYDRLDRPERAARLRAEAAALTDHLEPA